MLINSVVPPRFDPRVQIKDIVLPDSLPQPDPQAVDLAVTVKAVMQTVLLEPSPDGLKLVLGEDTLAVAIKAGLKTVPALILQSGSDRSSWANAFAGSRSEFSEQLVMAQKYLHLGWNDVEIAQALGLSMMGLDKIMNCLNLDASLVQKAIAHGATEAALVALSKAPAEVRAASTQIDGKLTATTVRSLLGAEQKRRSEMQPSLLCDLEHPHVLGAVAKGDAVQATVVYNGKQVVCNIPVEQVLVYANEDA